jgi:hypothetical protein
MIFNGKVKNGSEKMLQFCNWNLYENFMNLQSCETNNLGQKYHFNAIFMARSKVYHKEKGGGLLPSLGHVKRMSSREVYDPKLLPFLLITSII